MHNTKLSVNDAMEHVWNNTKIDSKGTTLPGRTVAAPISIVSPANVSPERPPILDISNKSHALGDEFVSNMYSECDSLANTVSAHAHMLLGNDIALESAMSQRPSNRTAAEVLNGLKRPAGIHVTDSQSIEDKSHMSHAKRT